ncbi:MULTISPECIES: efflux RND transporter periplasmic adaptor subunit [Brevibacillus]|jgi:multidrug resistance efflux pump|uniref:efflux RND transporter periplasmic adaptor subunit n=1 Tax=Brevibacillus TaxID=55080 RepID=UPI00046A5A17|nr:efflux RND transporter periplasmic adaptor subunit [Brevibacillus borstelensis]KKX55508.1 RND transporter [Brevibacillus borstelensis cifa_chp40]MBE5397526.1 efflux RND transporter periplasmic adaptor subunit [Brevibacillus borstelensis]MCC0564936.1 efflux RND transporter periplasmic adaptor subunit [Brevibacillus borstelensis]MCM3469166.1 efflux RND transporter periplasmic adaptor subunit [Brevibacillus borstelensis]MCM3560055.1 efflux RND transporter periplasmic adaptor subunit [Brevibaci
MNKARQWKTLGTVLAAVSLIAAGCSEPSSAGPSESAPVVKVWKADMAGTSAISNGKIAAADEIQVVSKLSGKVAQVNVKEGSVVKKGDILVTLEATDYLEQMKQAEAAIASAQARLHDTQAGARTQELQRLASGVEQAKATLQVAENTANRMKALFDSGAISQAEYEKTTLDLEKARTALDQAQAQYDLAKEGPTSNTIAALQAEVSRLQSSLELAKNTYQNTMIQSPISGIVAKKNIDPGEMAQPGAPLLVLVNMDRVKVEASVPQEQINQIKVGAPVDVKVNSLGGKVLKGTVEFVSPISDANSSSFPIKVTVDNKDGELRAGMLAEVYLPNQAEASNSWKVPASSIVTKDNKHYVFKVDQDVVHQVEVSVGETSGEWTSVTQGVNQNDRLVLTPTDSLAEGSKVIVN